MSGFTGRAALRRQRAGAGTGGFTLIELLVVLRRLRTRRCSTTSETFSPGSTSRTNHRDMLRDAESALIQSLDGVHKIQRAIPAARSTTPAG